jgi:hypothetical protein
LHILFPVFIFPIPPPWFVQKRGGTVACPHATEQSMADAKSVCLELLATNIFCEREVTTIK